MEQSINRVELLGRTGNRPTLRQTPNGTPVTQFSLYTNQLWRNYYLAEGEEQLPEADRGDVPIDECDATLTGDSSLKPTSASPGE